MVLKPVERDTGMKVDIEKEGKTYYLRIHHRFSRESTEIWHLIAENEGLRKWFPQLKIEVRDAERILVFAEGDFREEMRILRFEEKVCIAYQWDSAEVSFCLYAVDEAETELLFTEKIPADFGNAFADAQKDMTGWLVQNECIDRLAKEKNLPDTEDLTEKWEAFVGANIAAL